MKWLITVCIYILLFSAYSSHAQVNNAGNDTTSQKSRRAIMDTSLLKWINSIAFLESAYKRTNTLLVMDTITGTAFLIADGNKFYLVTSKHVIQSSLSGINKILVNNEVYIRVNQNEKDGLKIIGLANSKSYVLSSDADDIAMISLQSTSNREVLTYLLNRGCKPFPVALIETSFDHKAGETVIIPSFSLTKGEKVRRIKALGAGLIKSYDATLPDFMVNSISHQGNNGAPVLSASTHKIMGVLSYINGIKSDEDIIQKPYDATTSANVVKAFCILPLLKKLQQNENTPDFNQ